MTVVKNDACRITAFFASSWSRPSGKFYLSFSLTATKPKISQSLCPRITLSSLSHLFGLAFTQHGAAFSTIATLNPSDLIGMSFPITTRLSRDFRRVQHAPRFDFRVGGRRHCGVLLVPINQSINPRELS